VVVRPDRVVPVVRGAGGLQISRGGVDRVGRVVGICGAVAISVGRIGLPGGRHELHPADRTGRRRHLVEPAEVGLDLVDRREDRSATGPEAVTLGRF